jgi:hypothetical protein
MSPKWPLLSALAFLGCGSSMSLSDFCTGYANNWGGLATACTWMPEDLAKAQASDLCTRAKAAVAANRMVYDPGSAKTCLAAIANATCATPSSWSTPFGPAICAEALHGASALHSACSADLDCEGVAYCSATTAGSCEGTCQAPVAASATCDPSASPAQCGPWGACVAGTCEAVTAAAGAQGDGCIPSSCQVGLRCDALASVCVPAVAEGQSCLPGHGECQELTFCASTNVCVRYGAPGSACDGAAAAGSEPAPCLPGSYCLTTSSSSSAGTCAAAKAEAASCQSGVECQSGACVHGQCTAACSP